MGISIFTDLGGIRGIIGIQPHLLLHRVWNTIIVGILIRCPAIHGISTYLINIRNNTLFIRVHWQTTLYIRRGLNGFRRVRIKHLPCFDLLDNTFVHCIPLRKGGTYIL